MRYARAGNADGSSLFPFIEAGSSDLYVVPRFYTALRIFCRATYAFHALFVLLIKDGEPLESSRTYLAQRASPGIYEVTGMEFSGYGRVGILCYFGRQRMFPATDQRGYHESASYAKFNEFRTECMAYTYH